MKTGVSSFFGGLGPPKNELTPVFPVFTHRFSPVFFFPRALWR
jgi:hypothetical protein